MVDAKQVRPGSFGPIDRGIATMAGALEQAGFRVGLPIARVHDCSVAHRSSAGAVSVSHSVADCNPDQSYYLGCRVCGDVEWILYARSRVDNPCDWRYLRGDLQLL